MWNVFRALFVMWPTDWSLYLQHGPLQTVQTRPTNNRIVSTVFQYLLKCSPHMHRTYTQERNFTTAFYLVAVRQATVHPVTCNDWHTGGREVQFFSCSISALRWQWAINTMRRPLSSRKTDKLPILEEAGRAPGPAWTNMEKRKRLTTTGGSSNPGPSSPLRVARPVTLCCEIINQFFVQLHLLGCKAVRFGRWVCFLTHNCLQQVLPKLRQLPAKLRNVIPHKTVILTLSTVRISELIF